jgi:hypothetical protein
MTTVVVADIWMQNLNYLSFKLESVVFDLLERRVIHPFVESLKHVVIDCLIIDKFLYCILYLVPYFSIRCFLLLEITGDL